MPTSTISSALEANLASVAQRDPEFAQRLREVEPSEQVAFHDTPQGIPAATVDGRQLCSRHRPADEAKRLADDVDLVEHAVIVFLGFGLGYHVKHVADRLGDAGVIVIFEPDLALLRAVFEQVDHANWLSASRIVWLTDPKDRSALAQRLSGMEALLGQGVHFAEHPSSRWRIPDEAAAFTSLLREYMTAARTTLMTTLIRSVETVRNLILNVDHYVASPGIADLENVATGFPAVVVSAGPSLQKNMHLLARPGVRDRCIIIAVQTTLKPLLAAGIKPHFVTALDISPISKRFYEDLTAEDVAGVTLIVEPKAHPVILDAFPGPIRCCGSGFLDKLMGEHAREMGHVLPGATVAHLSVYFARHLGCNPVIMIGQDLGFTDGLYYSAGTAIHDVWTPELNPFNTIEMMEWQRIVRHRSMLHKLEDIDGKEIISDSQLVTYLAQFERDFAGYRREGVRIIDATEGGVRKQHTEIMSLEAALDECATRDLPPLRAAMMRDDDRTRRAVLDRIAAIRRDIARIGETSRRTIRRLEQMLDDQADRAKMDRHFRQIEKLKREVESRQQAFDLVNLLNQLGMFKRVKADRRLQVLKDLTPLERQRAELERDRENVAWIADASQELVDQLVAAERLLRGERIIDVKPSRRRINESGELEQDAGAAGPSRIAAIVPIDPERNGLGVRRSLGEPFAGRPVIQATLERLGRVRSIESIILLTPRGFDIQSLIDPDRIGRPVEIEWLPEGITSPFGPEHEAIAAARRWSEMCWRGGIAGMSVYDEVLCPQAIHPVVEKRGLTAVLLCAPDWPLIDVSDDQGCNALIARHLEQADRNKMVFTQAPPGLGCILLSASLIRQFASRNRLATVGGLMVYQPHAPQGDPIVYSNNVQIDHRIRRAQIRATYDAPTYRALLKRAVEPIVQRNADFTTAEVVAAIEADFAASALAFDLPQHLILELCTERATAGPANRHPCGHVTRPPIRLKMVESLCIELAGRGDAVLTLDGVGDPLLHSDFDRIIHRAKDLGVMGVHVRTDLLASHDHVDRLLNSGVDVITVTLNADRAATYEAMTGTNRFRDVLENVQHIVERQRRLTPQKGTSALVMPWLVPRIQRRRESYHDIETFFDRWQHTLGAAVIEGPPPFEASPESPADSLRPAVMPDRAMQRELDRRMMVLSDGSAVISELDLTGEYAVGSLRDQPLRELWRRVSIKRRAWRADPDACPLPLRTLHP